VGFEDMMRRVPDLSKIQRLIGYRPTYDLDAILRDVIAEAQAAAPTSPAAPGSSTLSTS
jgi:UDP-glucose 4-epimerase